MWTCKDFAPFEKTIYLSSPTMHAEKRIIIRRKTNENYIPPEEPAMTVCVEGDEIRLEEFVRSKRNVKVHGRADCH